jgi:hypothetical protein
MSCKGRAGIPHCPPLTIHRCCQLPGHHMMAPGMAHFHVAGTRASNLIRIAAPGPAWEESMSPADFILLTNWLDSPCSVQPHPLRGFGSRVSRNEYPCVIGSQWWRPALMSYDGPFREGKHPSVHSWYYCARCLCICCPAAVGVQVL